MRISFSLVGIVIIAIFIIAWNFHFYPGIYCPPKIEMHKLSNTTYPVHSTVQIKEEGNGTILVVSNGADLLLLEERIAALGYDIDYLDKPIEEKLKEVIAAVFFAPSFNEVEIKELSKFADKGGRILILAEPENKGDVNSLAEKFGMHFEEGYLYDTETNFGNYRYVIVDKIKSDETTFGIRKLALYTVCSIKGHGVAWTTNTALSFGLTTVGPFSPISHSENVVAICDVTFLQRGFNEVADNNNFITNLLRFLSMAERNYTLDDWPYFLKENITISYVNESFLEQALELKNAVDSSLLLDERFYSRANGIRIGYYNSTSTIKDISIDNQNKTFTIPEIGTYEQTGKALLVLEKHNENYQLSIIGDSPEEINLAIKQLIDEKIKKFMLRDDLALILS